MENAALENEIKTKDSSDSSAKYVSQEGQHPLTGQRAANYRLLGQPVSRTQASDAMTSRLPCYEAKCATQVLPMRGPLAAEIGLPVCGTPVNFNGFPVLASLLHRRGSTDVNETLHDVWPSHGLVHYLYIFGGSCPVTEFYHVQNSLCVQVLRSPILAALLHGTRIVGVSQTLWRSAKGVAYIRQGGHHVGHRPTF